MRKAEASGLSNKTLYGQGQASNRFVTDLQKQPGTSWDLLGPEGIP